MKRVLILRKKTGFQKLDALLDEASFRRQMSLSLLNRYGIAIDADDSRTLPGQKDGRNTRAATNIKNMFAADHSANPVDPLLRITLKKDRQAPHDKRAKYGRGSVL